MCQNVGTAAGRMMLADDIPLIFTGSHRDRQRVKQPRNYLTRIEPHCPSARIGRTRAATERLIVGGPMMGFTVDNTCIPVVKPPTGLIAASHSEVPDAQPEQACIRCGFCVEACQMSLLPQQLFWYS